MTKQQLLELAAFKTKPLYDAIERGDFETRGERTWVVIGAHWQHARDMKLIEALIDSRERLRGALDKCPNMFYRNERENLVEQTFAVDDEQLAKLIKGEM